MKKLPFVCCVCGVKTCTYCTQTLIVVVVFVKLSKPLLVKVCVQNKNGPTKSVD